MQETNDFNPDFFSITQMVANYVKYVIKKEPRSALDDKLGDIQEGMTLLAFVNNQVDKDFYKRTIEGLDKLKHIKDPDAARAPPPEENKEEPRAPI
jgi:hypothetical protein